MDNDEINRQLDIHFVRVVNMCRNGITDDEIRITADFCQLPQWMVMRIAHDLHTLTPTQEERYQKILERMTKDA